MLELKHISFDAVSHEGSGEKEILKDINLVIEDKSFVVVTGPNGSGKSTLAKVIAGLVQPTGGQIILDGQDITKLSITERARLGIGFAFQQPVRFKGLTVLDMLAAASGKTLSVDTACDYLAEVGLCARDYVHRELNGSLSGGELKRIEIAMLAARGSKLSIFDEPEAGIDLWSFQNLIKVFEKMRDAHDSGVMIISHQERILDIADKIVVLADGEIIRVGPKEDIMPCLLMNSNNCKFFSEEAFS